MQIQTVDGSVEVVDFLKQLREACLEVAVEDGARKYFLAAESLAKAIESFEDDQIT